MKFGNSAVVVGKPDDPTPPLGNRAWQVGGGVGETAIETQRKREREVEPAEAISLNSGINNYLANLLAKLD